MAGCLGYHSYGLGLVTVAVIFVFRSPYPVAAASSILEPWDGLTASEVVVFAIGWSGTVRQHQCQFLPQSVVCLGGLERFDSISASFYRNQLCAWVVWQH